MSSILEQVRSKILDVYRLQTKIEEWRKAKQRIVFTNGCFDILHLGHLSYLIQSAQKGDKLIVGLNSDASVRIQNKSPQRPIQDQNSRAIALASLSYVDAVVVFESETPLNLIELLKPDLLIKGADYNPSEKDSSKKSYIVGSNEVKSYGGEVEVVPLLEGYSTTEIVNRIKA